jgi:HK97 family phage major capsid protein
MTKSFIFGSKVKAENDGKISGWLVRFSDGSKRDLEGEYFTKNTDFGIHFDENNEMKTTVLYHHGLDETIGLDMSIPGTIKKFDEGIWIDSQLDLSDRYQKAVSKILPRLGWSAGTASHLVKTVNGEIKSFPLGLDASLTPTPAEPTTLPTMLDMVTMKSLSTTSIEDVLEGVNANTSLEIDNLIIKTNEVKIMSEKDKNEAVDETQQPENEALKNAEAKVKELGEKIKSFTDLIEKSGKLKDMGYIAPDDEDSKTEIKSLGDFCIAIKNNNTKRLKSVYKAQVEKTGVDGGYLVPEEFLPQIYQVMKEESGIMQRVTMQAVNSPTGQYPALDQYITPTAGIGQSAFNAGMDGVARAEGGSYTETDMDFTMIKWDVSDAVSGIVKVSRELSQDAPIIESLLTNMISQVQRTKTEYFILRGTGVNQPLGILNSAAKIDITPGTDGSFTYGDALNMLSRFKSVGGQPAWLMHPSVFPDVGNMESSAGGGVFQANYGASLGNVLLGYPVLFSEHLPQANNSGDVILADLRGYVLFNLGGVYVDFSEHAFFSTGYNAWRFGHRLDGKPQIKEPITLADPQGSYTVSPFVNHND